MFKIFQYFSLIITILGILIGIYIYYRHSQRKDFDLTPRDKTGDEIDEVDEEDNPALAPVYEGDVVYEDWLLWEDFLKEAGIIEIKDGMIEYETGDNSRLFVGLAEMQQSNPYLKTDEELAQENAYKEVFFNGVQHPIKISTQSQRVEMTDFLNELKNSSMRAPGATPQMKEYASKVLDATLKYQNQTDRFENRAYLQFMAIIKPDEVYGDTAEALEIQIHEKAAEKLMRQIANADGILSRADHPIAQLDTFGLLEVLYKTFNRETSVKTRLEDIIKAQRYQIYTSAWQSSKQYKKVQQEIQIEKEVQKRAREILLEQQEKKNEELLAQGKDYYSDTSVESKSNENNNENNQKEDLFDFSNM